MRSAAFLLAVFLVVWSIPAVARVDSAFRDGPRWRVVVEGVRALAAIAAATGLFVWLARTR